MDRRAFLGALTSAPFAVPNVAEAQQTGKVYRVAYIAGDSELSALAGREPVHPAFRAFVQRLRALGYAEGQNLILERRAGRYEQFGEIVAELVRLKTDVIVTGAGQVARAAKAVTTTVPIVMVTSVDPVVEGLVQSLARPGGNVTGLTYEAGPEIDAKRLQLFSAMLPGISHIAYLGSKEFNDWESPYGKGVRSAAQALGVTMMKAEFLPHQHSDAFARIARAGVKALFVSAGPTTYVDRGVIVDLATRARLPSTFRNRESVELGALMSYGANNADLFRRAAGYVDKILKGAKPGDLPVEQPITFELVINLKTAKALDLAIPPLVLARADDVIQ
jgi:putative ABC transport system substrate-binding protein